MLFLGIVNPPHIQQSVANLARGSKRLQGLALKKAGNARGSLICNIADPVGTTQIRIGMSLPIAISGQPKASALKPVMEPAEPWTIDWSRKPDASTDDHEDA